MVKFCNMSYKNFLDKVGNLGSVYYNDLYEHLKKTVFCEDISSYSEFMDKIGNLNKFKSNTNTFGMYHELYTRIYETKKGGRRAAKKSRRKARKPSKKTRKIQRRRV